MQIYNDITWLQVWYCIYTTVLFSKWNAIDCLLVLLRNKFRKMTEERSPSHRPCLFLFSVALDSQTFFGFRSEVAGSTTAYVPPITWFVCFSEVFLVALGRPDSMPGYLLCINSNKAIVICTFWIAFPSLLKLAVPWDNAPVIAITLHYQLFCAFRRVAWLNPGMDGKKVNWDQTNLVLSGKDNSWGFNKLDCMFFFNPSLKFCSGNENLQFSKRSVSC